MTIFLPLFWTWPLVRYPKLKTQWVNKTTWPSVDSHPDSVCYVKNVQPKPHFEVVMYGSFQIEDNSCLFK